ncbi:MAG: ParB/RepB/Spo0J family partition protein [Hyphomicrobiaceae bacterium]|nr:ParB/RepB/Spo0J family partition protein [Hyphomicrobiaceae bacterium]
MNQPLHSSRLGRGLASLIGEARPARSEAASAEAGAGGPVPEGEHRLVAIDRIHPGGHNPRRTFAEDDLAELAASIKENGIIQPIVVRPDAKAAGHYEIVAGERRWRASRLAGLSDVPVVVREMTDQQAHEWALIENVQRADLNAIEEALGYRELVERFQYSQEQISEKIGKSRSHVANTLRLLRLPEAVQALVQMGQLTAGHARALIGRDDAETLAERIIAEDLNVRAVEAMVQGGVGGAEGAQGARKVRDKDPDTRAFERELTDLLGLKVEIKRGSGESGNLVIKYGNFDQLEWIRMRLTGGHG